MKQFIVMWSGGEYECNSLVDAIDFSKGVCEYVTIRSDDFELIGIFGTDFVVDGILPSGAIYDWKKRR